MRTLKTTRSLLGCLLVASFANPIHAQAPVATSPAPQQADLPPWMKAFAIRQQQLIDQNGPGTDPALRDHLLKDAAIDQQARTPLMEEAKRTGKPPDVSSLSPIDAKLTADLKEIVAAHGWPTIHLVGLEASNAAMLLLIHTADHAWQESLFAKLEQLATEGKIDGSQLATAIDKQLVSAGKLQRYGTQFKFAEGHMVMYAVEDPDHLDSRRVSVMLPPIEVYKEMLSSAYGSRTANDVATPPARP